MPTDPDQTEVLSAQPATPKAEKKTVPAEKEDKPPPSFKTRAEIGNHQLQALLPVRST